jgi:PmbA protein
MNNKERMDLAEWAVKEAIKSGADEASVSIYNGRGIQVECRDKRIEKLEDSTQNSLSLDIYTQKKYSGNSTNDLKKESLQKFIKEAVAATRYLSEDEFRKLTDPKYYPSKSIVDMELEILDSHYHKIEPADRVKIASEIEKIALAQSDKIISVSTGYYDTYSEGVRVKSNGFKGDYQVTDFTAGASVTVKDDNGGRPENSFYPSARFFKDLPAAELIAKTAVNRALKKIGQKKIESGKYTMIVDNLSLARLLYMLNEPMSARALQQKRSFLDGMLGKKIASEKLTVIDDPFIKKGLGSRTYDDEGVAAKKRIIIDKGILNCYFIDNYYGRKLGMEVNSGSPSNVIFELGTRSMDDMVKDVKKGILINGFIGGNSNSTTGDFSLGIVGLYIENGSVVHAINEMNISGNNKEFWNQLAEVGNDPNKYSSFQSPSMMFEGVNFSGL